MLRDTRGRIRARYRGWLLALVCCACLGSLLVTPAGSSATPTGLVAAYSFDEGTGATVADASGNGNTGTVTDGTWTTGVHGDALSFNGSSTVVTIPDSSSLELTNAMTLEAWVERTTLAGASSDVIDKGSDDYYLEGASSSHPNSAPAAGGTIGGSTAEAGGSAQLQPATWTHVAATYDGSDIRLYVNGTEVADTPHSGTLETSGNPLTIGGDSSFGRYFTGAIDDVRVYDTALTAAQIRTDMNTPVGGATPSTFLLSPATAELTTGQGVQFTATAAVTWSVDGIAGGNSTSGTITSGGVYAAPSSAGTHTVTATASDGRTASATVYVSNDPNGGLFTFHNDNARTGENTHETVLTHANVKQSTFGKLFSYPLDGLTFASPLYVQNESIAGGTHNVVYVATEHDSLYAFDADGQSDAPLWHDTFIGGSVEPIPPADTGETSDIPNEIGITGTPVIDKQTNTMYVVTADKNTSGASPVWENWLHALDLSTGADHPGSPVLINPTFPGTGVDSENGIVEFTNTTENQRSALLFANGKLYVAFANHGFNPPYHGWLMQYDPTSLAQEWVFNTSPDAQSGGIWMGGDGIAADSSGQLYFSTGNGTFDAGSGGRDYGDSLLKLNHADGTVNDYFTPYNYQALDTGDTDLASGGIILLPDQSGTHPHEVLAAGKGGTIYVVDRDSMGHVGSTDDSQIVQSLVSVFPTGGGFDTGNYSSPVYFDGAVYYAPIHGAVMRFSLTNGLLSTTPASESPEVYNGDTTTFTARGGALSASANGTANGILWGLQSNGDSLPGTLHAYDPADLATEYYNSDEAGNRDQLDPWLKFTIPTDENGRVYVVSAGRLTAFGLLPGLATSSAPSGGGGGGGGGGGSGGGGGGGVAPDLHVTLTASATTAPPVGSPLNYAVAVSTANVGSSSDVKLTLTLPAGYVVSSTYADRGPGCKGTAPTLTCDVAWISPGVTSHVLVSGFVGQAGEQDATATVTSLLEPELNPADNTMTVTLAPPAPTPTPTPAPTPHPIVLAAMKAPVLHGTAKAGHVLRAVAPVWSETPSRVRFSWQVCVRSRCTTIPKATGKALRLRKTWIGRRIRFVAVGIRGSKSVASRSPLLLVRG